ncbi:MAG TPA: PaaX family transcriptional regulator C-terminal domain-containing protein [Streptosporangiaceae bacterium]|jgi:phenylacetic acid degradation operon negative regulatory protein
MQDREAEPATVRPQTLLLTFLGDHVLGRNVCVYSGSYLDVMARVGVSEHATRSTLTRMVRRGLLGRRRQGRKVFFGLTPHSTEILADGEARIWGTGPVNIDGDGEWTLVGFSLPQEWRRLRHDLRSRLTWSGFGMIHSGLWIAPSRVDLSAILAELGLEDHVKVFSARLTHPADIGPLLRDAYDLAGLAERYETFLRRWSRPEPLPDHPDPLARKLFLLSEWLETIRHDPRLPLPHLPSGWPAPRAHQVLEERHAELAEPARLVAGQLLETLPD